MGSYRETQRQPLMVSSVKAPIGLQMTDYFFLISFFLLLFWALDPFRVSLDSIPVIKRVPSVMLMMNFSFIIVATLLTTAKSQRVPVVSVLRDSKWLIAFSVMVVSGSVYARFISGIEETFLTFGTYVLMAPLMYWYILNSAAPLKLLRAILLIIFLWGGIAACVQFVQFRKLEAFHAREHLVLPILAMAFFGLPKKWGVWAGAALVAATAIAAAKNTAYMVALLCLLYMFGLLFGLHVAKIRDPFIRFMKWVGVVALSLLVIAVLAVVYWKFKDALPTGNPEYRLHTYQQAWEKFLSSPLYGIWFSQAAVAVFDQFEVAAVTQNLPTHSDPLDMLANGGVLALGLWLMAIVPVFLRSLWDVCLKYRYLEWQDALVVHSFWVMSLAAILVCIFNPIYNLPNLAMATWMQFGCLMAVYKLCREKLS